MSHAGSANNSSSKKRALSRRANNLPNRVQRDPRYIAGRRLRPFHRSSCGSYRQPCQSRRNPADLVRQLSKADRAGFLGNIVKPLTGGPPGDGNCQGGDPVGSRRIDQQFDRRIGDPRHDPIDQLGGEAIIAGQESVMALDWI